MRSSIFAYSWLLALACLAPGCGDGAAARHPDVVLITVDTLRADHLGIYGYERPTTPNLDRWFAPGNGGAVFERSWSTEASTSPSVASILSGELPQEHGVRLFYQVLPEETRLVTDRLPPEYQKAAFVSNMVLTDEAIGFASRFDHYDDFVDERESERKVFERTAKRTTEAALVWMVRELDPERPLFLWVHYIDPHGPYRAPEDAPVRFEHEGGTTIDPERVPKFQRDPDLTDGEVYVDRYDEEIAFVDGEIDKLLSVFSELRSLDDSLLLFTSDHGESMMEHEKWFTHGYHVYDEITRVPFLLRGPGVEPGRFDAPVTGLDVVPTILGFAGGAVPLGMRGADLRRGSQLDADRTVYAEAAGRDHQWRMAVRGTRKWMIQLRGPLRRVLETRLYDLAADPGELEPLAWTEGEATAEALLELVRTDPDPSGVPERHREGIRIGSPKVSPDADEDARQALEDLGYVDQ